MSGYRNKIESIRNDTFGKWSREIIKNYRTNKNDTGPTRFSEFLKWWLDGKMRGSDNEHWLPYRNLINPCAYQWDYILKLENIEQESKWLFSEFNITEIEYPPGNVLQQQIVRVHLALTSFYRPDLRPIFVFQVLSIYES